MAMIERIWQVISRGKKLQKSSRALLSTSVQHGRRATLGMQRLESRLVLSTTPLITEFMASNQSTLQDFSGDYPDWIEIHNPTSSPIDLAGWYLTDSSADLTRWQFPSGPTSVLELDEYLILFASSKYGDPGIPTAELHTNFKLNAEGEYTPFFPEQLPDISYGLAHYYTTPTPGRVNVQGSFGIVADTNFSVDRGFFDTPFSVEITTATAEAEIRYTLDGSIPMATTATIYTEPIHISSSTILRAAAFKPGYLSTNVDTQTYLFLDNVLQQNEAFGIDGSGLAPFSAWGHVGADWEVDPDITGHTVPDNRLTSDDLQSVPTISLVLPWDDMFAGDGQGIYISGDGSPRGASVELILENGSTGFQIDGSVQIQGGTSVNRWKTDKLSMRIKFTAEFGPTKLHYSLFGVEATDQFDTFILDATLNHNWTHPSTDQTDTAKFIQDQYVANLQNAMGHYAPHGRFQHLYINGLYWGMYCIHERPDESFAAEYLGGDKDDYDILKHNSLTVVHGSSTNYHAMLDLARQNLSSDAHFQNLAAVLDIDAFIDYMLLNFYAGNTDWAHQNWYASYNRVDPNGRWRFHSWDAEHVLKDVADDVTGKNNSGGPTEIHQNLSNNAEYRMMFADHVQRHFFNDGILTPSNAAAAYQRLLDEIDRAIVGESARWGDNRVESAYTRNDWLSTQNALLDNYFPQRTAEVLNQLQSRNLFPNVDAPVFNHSGGHVASGYELTISAANEMVYYTLDGSDPRAIGGGISAAASRYSSSPIIITAAVTIKARRLDGSDWSPLSEISFYVTPQADALAIWISHFGTAAGADHTDGDADEDGDVDGNDFLSWQQNHSGGAATADDLVLWKSRFGTAAGADHTDGDADEDGDVDGNDFLIWQQNYDRSAAILQAMGDTASRFELPRLESLQPTRPTIRERTVDDLMFQSAFQSWDYPDRDAPSEQSNLAANRTAFQTKSLSHGGPGFLPKDAPSRHHGPNYRTELEIAWEELERFGSIRWQRTPIWSELR
jgi:CotH protein/chitobiase/beta-hexosaminidase-like protein/lamin tail-like protein